MKDKIMMIVFVLILGTILATTLVGVDAFTEPMIAKNEKIKELSTILKTFGIEYTDETIEKVFTDNISTIVYPEMTIYKVSSGEMAFPFEGSGFQGPIIGVAVMADDKKTITAVGIKSQVETPGLGSRITEKQFLDSFIGKQFDPELILVGAGKSSNKTDVDGITGATMSCIALIKVINDDYKIFNSTFKGD
ncbi:MAG: FMN-binding protein [Spirochaetia bacterium]|jgi:Na+-transporting NADH:ubiquinone oxidoreductase subunit NqrC|nr:FMN-binding protein [Spirochaetia bacterium]